MVRRSKQGVKKPICFFKIRESKDHIYGKYKYNIYKANQKRYEWWKFRNVKCENEGFQVLVPMGSILR